MAQDGISLLTEFLRTHRHTHLNVGYIPFCPGTTIHPNATIVQPLGSCLLLLVDGCQYGICTLAVGTMRIGKVGSHIDLMWLNLREQFDNRRHVVFCHREFLNLTTLIEWQVEEVDMMAVDAVVLAGQTRLTSADQSFQTENLLIVEVALLLILDEGLHRLVGVLDDLVGTIGKDGVEAIDEMHETTHFLIAHSDIARSLVGHMHIVLLLHESTDGTSHRDDIIIGVG